MRNPLVILRYVLHAFLLYLNILAMGFAAWNIAALKSAGIGVNGASAFVVFNACCFILYAGICLAEAYSPSLWNMKVMPECVWIGAFGFLQVASAIDITISGPTAACVPETSLSACASSSLVVVIVWISSSILLFYFFALVGITVVHVGSHPAVWASPISSVSWFTPEEKIQGHKSKDMEKGEYENPAFKADEAMSARPVSRTQVQSASRFSIMKGFTISAPRFQNAEGFRPAWAKDVNPRRGVDLPFAAKPKVPTVKDRLRSYWSASSTDSMPPVPPKAYTNTSRYLERLDANSDYVPDTGNELNLPVITPSPSRPLSYGIFPEDVQDPDVPIHTSHRSEWITAHDNRRPVQTIPPWNRF
ncbi:uncharacterized protein FIBRA_00435 [Fibroporia radiculosa]|uniref:MARVEL domain-containing protein n=1 Tax=Fibroporia radiculosa TaxID=599839 RepID=J4G082_9APHY|nr:uncharacterized protein FIBRA_00435 [Fibroporia radiculosa]CCL98438.1 predicted protein [Fibroporia radiculosa]